MVESNSQNQMHIGNRIVDFLVGAHSSIRDAGERRQARLVSSILLAIAVLSCYRIISSAILGHLFTDSTIQTFSIMIFMFFVAYGISRSRFYRFSIVIALFAMTAFIVAIMVVRGSSPAIEQMGTTLWLMVSVILGGLLLPWWGGLIWGVINFITVLLLPNIVPDLELDALTSVWSIIIVVTALVLILSRSRDRQEQDRRNDLLTVNQELTELKDALELRVQQASRELALAAEVGRKVSLVRDLDRLLSEAVELIKDSFDLYYVQVYLPDALERHLVLRAGTGDVGRRLHGRGHQLPISLTSITGSVAVERRAVIVEDTETSTVHQPNPLLPETCAEMAVPLLLGERVIGVLDLQSSQPGLLTEESLPAFEALAGQLAVAIVNADLFAQLEQTRQQVEQQARALSRQGWDEFLDGIANPERIGFFVEQEDIHPLQEMAETDFGSNTLRSPIRIAGEEIGEFQIEGDEKWTRDQQELVDNIAQQVASQVENLRLVAQSQQYRHEAENALRRLTREGWDYYQQAARLGFVHTNERVKPLSDEEIDPKNVWTLDFKVRDEPIGTLGVVGATDLPEADQALIAEVQEQLSAHIDGLRLAQQTEQALTATEKLYQGSERIVHSSTPQQVLDAVVDTTILREMKRVGLVIYDHPWIEDDQPEGMTVMASWTAPGEETQAPVGTYYTLAEYPLTSVFGLRKASFFHDLTADERFDEKARAYFSQVLGAKGVITLPLLVGQQSIGGIVAMSGEPLEISEDETRQLTGLVDQAATVLMSQRLYSQAQSKAAREQALREISEAVRSSTDTEVILRTAVRELGKVLGRRTAIRLKSGNSDFVKVEQDNGSE